METREEKFTGHISSTLLPTRKGDVMLCIVYGNEGCYQVGAEITLTGWQKLGTRHNVIIMETLQFIILGISVSNLDYYILLE